MVMPGLISDHHGQHRAEAFAAVNGAPGLAGVMFSLVIGGALALQWSWRAPYMILTAVIVVALTVVAWPVSGARIPPARCLHPLPPPRARRVRSHGCTSSTPCSAEFAVGVWAATYLKEVGHASGGLAAALAAVFGVTMFLSRVVLPTTMRLPRRCDHHDQLPGPGLRRHAHVLRTRAPAASPRSGHRRLRRCAAVPVDGRPVVRLGRAQDRFGVPRRDLHPRLRYRRHAGAAGPRRAGRLGRAAPGAADRADRRRHRRDHPATGRRHPHASLQHWTEPHQRNTVGRHGFHHLTDIIRRIPVCPPITPTRRARRAAASSWCRRSSASTATSVGGRSVRGSRLSAPSHRRSSIAIGRASSSATPTKTSMSVATSPCGKLDFEKVLADVSAACLREGPWHRAAEPQGSAGRCRRLLLRRPGSPPLPLSNCGNVFDAASSYYGGGTRRAGRPDAGRADDHALRRTGPRHPARRRAQGLCSVARRRPSIVYDAEHGFNCDHRGIVQRRACRPSPRPAPSASSTSRSADARPRRPAEQRSSRSRHDAPDSSAPQATSATITTAQLRVGDRPPEVLVDLPDRRRRDPGRQGLDAPEQALRTCLSFAGNDQPNGDTATADVKPSLVACTNEIASITPPDGACP